MSKSKNSDTEERIKLSPYYDPIRSLASALRKLVYGIPPLSAAFSDADYIELEALDHTIQSLCFDARTDLDNLDEWKRQQAEAAELEGLDVDEPAAS